MTFEEWWAGPRPTSEWIPDDADEERFRMCWSVAWNAALDEATKHGYAMDQLIAARAVAVDELEDLKIKIEATT